MRVRRRRFGAFHLQVVGDDHARRRSLGERYPHGSVDEVADLTRLERHLDVLVRHVLEQAEQVDLLLVVAAQTKPGLLADDRDHRLMVELRVVEPVQEVDRARPGGCQADARLARELRVRAGHERRHLLVANLDELGTAG